MADRHTPNPDEQQDAESFDSTLSEQPLAAENPTPAPADAGTDTKATGSRAASRSTRILLGALLLALAAFIWFNYVWEPDAAAPQVTVGGNGNGAVAGIGQNGLSGPAGLPLVAGQDQDQVEDQQGATELPLIASPDAPAPAAAETEDGPVAPLSQQPGVAARDLEIVELPFLVTQPPAESADEDIAAEDDPSVTRPDTVRASVNPFSPVVLTEPTASAERAPDPTVPTAADAPAPQDPVIEVSIPDGPDQTAITTIAPPPGTVQPTVPAAQPAAVTPPAVPPAAQPVAESPAETPTSGTAVQTGSSIAQSLPRPLPGAPLSPVPAVLQERRAAEDVPQPNLAQVATVAEPAAEVDPAVADRVADTDLGIPEVLPPAASRVMPTDGDPLVAGATPLSRYLRDNDVTFTGMVLGPVSQGVFRSATDPRAVVVGLGQNLPETEITLTDLRGQQAEFTLADASQFLTLDLRR